MSLDIKVIRKGGGDPVGRHPLEPRRQSKPQFQSVPQPVRPKLAEKTPTLLRKSTVVSESKVSQNKLRQTGSRRPGWLVLLFVVVVGIVCVVIFSQPKDNESSTTPAGVVDTLKNPNSPVPEPDPVLEETEVPVRSQADIFNLKLEEYRQNLDDFRVYTDELKKMDNFLNQ